MIDAGLMRYAVRHSTYCCHCHSLFDKLMISIKTCENKPRSLHLLLSACQQESLFNSAPLKLSQSNSAQLMCMKEQHFYMLSFFLIFFFFIIIIISLPSYCPFFADQCPELFSPCPMELWEWLDQQTVKLE